MVVEDFKFKFDPVVQAQLIQRCYEFDKTSPLEIDSLMGNAKSFLTLVAKNYKRGKFPISTDTFRCWSDWGKDGADVIVLLSMRYKDDCGLLVKLHKVSSDIDEEVVYDNLPEWLQIHLYGVVRWKRLYDKDRTHIKKSISLEQEFYQKYK